VITSVKVEGCYGDAKEVPRIGQRRWMRVNGSRELMTLNAIEAKRRGVYEFNERTLHNQFVVEFSTTEYWGDYY
jgi:hypothetical protein